MTNPTSHTTDLSGAKRINTMNTLPPIVVVAKNALCPFCREPLSWRSLDERESCIHYGTDQTNVKFECGTTWFLPDSNGLEVTFRHCGPKELQTAYGVKKPA
jgi:hypothetical protein